MRLSEWSSCVCSSDLISAVAADSLKNRNCASRKRNSDRASNCGFPSMHGAGGTGAEYTTSLCIAPKRRPEATATAKVQPGGAACTAFLLRQDRDRPPAGPCYIGRAAVWERG